MPTISEALRKNLTPEQYGQVMDALGDDFDFDLVPRSRLNKVIKQRNELREQLAGNPQNPDIDDDDEGAGAAGGNKAKGNQTGNPVDVASIQKQHKAELANLAISYSALDKLRAAKAKDPELILKAGLLDLKGAKVSEDGTTVTWPEGDKDPFVALTGNEAYKYLFDVADPDTNKGSGKNTANDNGVPAGTGKDTDNDNSGNKSQLDDILDQAMGIASTITPTE